MIDGRRVAVICGGRHNHMSQESKDRLLLLLLAFNIKALATGGATGIDSDAAEWAEEYGHWLKVHTFHAEWEAHGKAAGPMRNTDMAKVADLVIAFPGNDGTKDMTEKALRKGIPVVIMGEGSLVPAQRTLFVVNDE